MSEKQTQLSNEQVQEIEYSLVTQNLYEVISDKIKANLLDSGVIARAEDSVLVEVGERDATHHLLFGETQFHKDKSAIEILYLDEPQRDGVIRKSVVLSNGIAWEVLSLEPNNPEATSDLDDAQSKLRVEERKLSAEIVEKVTREIERGQVIHSVERDKVLSKNGILLPMTPEPQREVYLTEEESRRISKENNKKGRVAAKIQKLLDSIVSGGTST